MNLPSYLKSQNAPYIDELWSRYQVNPEQVDSSWRFFFEGLAVGQPEAAAAAPAPAEPAGATATRELRVAELILAYRRLGHLSAKINPLADAPSRAPELALERFGLTSADLATTFAAGTLIGLGPAPLASILARLEQTYCASIGIETGHLQGAERAAFVTTVCEAGLGKPDAATRKHILQRLTQSETFERFLHTRYVAQKRFSVEGGEAIIPALDCVIERGAELGVQEVVVGMAHRGRLNVLTHTFGKKASAIFSEFEGNYKSDPKAGDGDVKYHKGYSADVTTRGGARVHLSLANNPSHLEFINCIVEGIVRAKQDLRRDAERRQVVPVLIHGDAAFAGQGVCYETLAFSQLEGYRTGGTVHFVINNQVGFTASERETRSGLYCTDLAKMLEAPIFHVNGDDADAVWQVTRLATEYRQRFAQDVVVDIVCYRKHGHNEGDEPAFTQPLMYQQIKQHPSPREHYAQLLGTEAVIGAAEAQALVDQVMSQLSEEQQVAKRDNPAPYTSVFEGVWKGLKRSELTEDLFKPTRTQVDAKQLLELSTKINHMQADFHLHPKLARFFEARHKAIVDGQGIDWGCAEALAYASLLSEGHPVRLSGQDAGRGTFSHRHSLLTDVENGRQLVPLNQISPAQARFEVINSLLSETGVMGFEHGYSLAHPNALVIWEAQFGDFANGAQVIIDQFLSSSESKWQRMSGLVLLLPHGYEGQGPEHSSARLERFLALCGRDNMIVANLSTPAQIFHALRRQLKWPFRKPLVVMSPKSVLRHPMAVSKLVDLSESGFREVIDDPEVSTGALDAKTIKRVVLCSGKVAYDLLTERTRLARKDVAIVRVEQLYPWPAPMLAELLARYPAAHDIVWTQEEPRNMGAWMHVFGTWMGGLSDFATRVGGRAIRYVGRDVAASPAVGSPKVHEVQQKALLAESFAERGKS